MLWNETSDDQKSGRIQQVWFPGVHSNVGGGYPKQGLSVVSLVWMMQEAEARGLRFVECVRQLYIELQNSTDKLYDSRAGLAGYYGYKPRDMAALCEGRCAARVHISAFERIAQATEGYAPGNLAAGAEIVTGRRGVYRTALASVVDGTFAERRALIRGAKPWITLWRLSQMGFVVATAAAALLYFRQSGMDGLSGFGSFSGYTRVGLFLWQQPVVSAALVITYLLCHLAASRLGRAYSEFWFQSRPLLRSALLGETARASKA